MKTVPYTEDERTDEAAGTGARLVIAMACVDPMARTNPALPYTIDLSGVHHVSIGRAGEGQGFQAVRGRFQSENIVTVAIPDVHLSSQHMQLSRESDGAQGFRVRDLSSTNGTWHNGERIDEARVADGDVLAIGMTILVFRAAGVAPHALDHAATDPTPPLPDELRTLDPELSALVATVRRLAPSELSVLVFGETGVGKEVMARAIHRLSGRGGPFVALNCGALSPALMNAELFGVERGAYTGAHSSRPGVVRSAHEGTLLLDEIAELPLDSQAVLLRVLQEKRVTPVGGGQSIPVDVRIIAATHQDLRARVASGAFRQDLLARLYGYALTVPPLRARREDIGLLIARLLPEVAGERAPSIQFGREAATQMFRYHWPDNIRELRQTLQAATLLSPDGVVRLAHLPERLTDPAPGASESPEPPAPPAPPEPPAPPAPPEPPEPRARTRRRRSKAERAAQESELRALLARHQGNLTAMGRELNTSASQVKRLLERYGIDRD